METTDVDPSRPLQLDDPEAKLEEMLDWKGSDLVAKDRTFLRDLAALAARVQKLRGLDFDALAKGLIAPGNGVEDVRTKDETVEDIEAKVDRVSADVGELGKEHNILQAELHQELDKLSERFEAGAKSAAKMVSNLTDHVDRLTERVTKLEGDA